MTQHESQEEVAHRILWGNVQSLREALLTLAEEARQSGDNEGSQARSFVEGKLAEIARGPSSTRSGTIWSCCIGRLLP
jgi:hypothetical protein